MRRFFSFFLEAIFYSIALYLSYYFWHPATIIPQLEKFFDFAGLLPTLVEETTEWNNITGERARIKVGPKTWDAVNTVISLYVIYLGSAVLVFLLFLAAVKILMALLFACIAYIWYVATSPFSASLSLTTPDHFHGTYRIVVCPTGKYAVCTILKNGKKVNMYCRPESSVVEQPFEPLTKETPVPEEEIELVDDNDVAHQAPGVQEIRYEQPRQNQAQPQQGRNYVNERRESPLSQVTTSSVAEKYYQMVIYLYVDGSWIENGKGVFLRGRKDDQSPYKHVFQTSWHIIIDAINAKSPLKIVNPKNGKFCYVKRLDTFLARNEACDWVWIRSSDADIAKLGATAYNAALTYGDDTTKISIGKAHTHGASTYSYVHPSLIPFQIEYKISTTVGDSGSALFVLGKDTVIGIHNWGLNNDTANRGVCLIPEYRRYFMELVETPTVAQENESPTQFAKRMRYLEKDAMEQYYRENPDDKEYFSKDEVDNYYERYERNRSYRSRNSNRPNDGGARLYGRSRFIPSSSITIEQDDEDMITLHHSSDPNEHEIRDINYNRLNEALQAYMVRHRLNEYNIHSIAQFDQFLSRLDQADFDDAYDLVSATVDMHNNYASSSGSNAQHESMYKAINKNSKQIHEATAAIKEKESKTEKLLQKVLEQQAQIAKQQQESFMELVTKLIAAQQPSQPKSPKKDFPLGVSKQEKPSSSSKQQEESAPLKKNNTSSNQRSSQKRTSQSLESSTSKSTNQKKERSEKKKNSSISVETTRSPLLAQQQNLDLSKLQLLVDKIVNHLPQAPGQQSPDTKQSSTQN